MNLNGISPSQNLLLLILKRLLTYGCTNNISTNTVTVTVDASITNTSDLDYSLNGGAYQTSNVFVNVPSGLGHYIDVRHTNGCIQRTAAF